MKKIDGNTNKIYVYQLTETSLLKWSIVISNIRDTIVETLEWETVLDYKIRKKLTSNTFG